MDRCDDDAEQIGTSKKNPFLYWQSELLSKVESGFYSRSTTPSLNSSLLPTSSGEYIPSIVAGKSDTLPGVSARRR
jgi:hypothetical protein